MSPLASPATIRLVATAAGVSTQTVSRVINNRPDVALRIRQRVEDVIKNLGYWPSALARSLVHQRTNTLPVKAWGIEYVGLLRTIGGIEQRATKLGYSLFLNLLSEPDASSYERFHCPSDG